MKEFLQKLSSSSPVPGGGGASAYAAAIGMSLGSMVANLTTGKKKYAQYQSEIEELIGKMDTLTYELASYMEKDAEVFEPLSRAYGLPKSTEEELAKRNEIMEKCLLAASKVPLELMDKVTESINILDRLAVIGSTLAISDVGVGVQMARAALSGAALNVYINTKAMQDRATAESMNTTADKLLIEGQKKCDVVYKVVLDKLK